MTEFDPKIYLQSLTGKPGVYSMLDAEGTVIYVGKAANLKKRVSSYFGKQHDSPKTRAMVQQIAALEVTVTASEGEALLLENNLIKAHKPRYNVMFRDDKSYPYLYLSTDETWPRLSFYRGKRTGKGRYFGPYPGAGAARRTLNLIQKLFRIRQCEDSFFRNRSRPCLQYQIKRCTAPCVEYISEQEYRVDVEHTTMFLEGKNEAVIQALTGPMQKAADDLNYERAAEYRDQIVSLRRVQENQYVTTQHRDIDIIACCLRDDTACVQLLSIRGGLNLGGKALFPSHARGAAAEDILSAFLGHYYLAAEGQHTIPPEILLSHEPEQVAMLQKLLSTRAGRQVKLAHRLRGERARWMEMAAENAAIALQQRISRKQSCRDRLESLRECLALEEPLERIECFDISHHGGDATVGSCVVFGPDGAVKSDYRRFNIDDITPGDDYAAMRQVLERRYLRMIREEGTLPDLILIDGGKGQLGMAREVMQELQLTDVPLLGVAKGPSRRPGMETLILADDRGEFRLPAGSSALHLIQEIRDEAHRFAITGHRRRRKQQQNRSLLEDIEGIGSRRRQQLLHHFGGMQGVERAGMEDLAKVPGINKNLAEKIYQTLHGE